MKTIKLIPNTSIMLIKTNDGVQTTFKSTIHKELFVNTHTEGTYELYNNYAIVNRYMVIDCEGTGWVLTKQSVTYEEALNIIQHYL